MRIWASRALSVSMYMLAGMSAWVGAAPQEAWAVDTRDTRFLHEPALGGGRLVFTYADDLWTAKPDGTDVRRLTAHPGAETSPHVSPDGKLVAFSGHYDGNLDVFVVPIGGGEPTRLTWHPGDDAVRGWTPDGRVLFASQRSVFTSRFSQLFTVAPTGGAARSERLPSADRGAVSPDGKLLAYTPLGERFRQWKNYRGGTATRIWVADRKSLDVVPIPQPEGRCNDTYPMWLGDDNGTVYFLSDRDGEFNLYAYDRDARKVTRLTDHDDHPIDAASAGDGGIVYEQGGYLHRFDPKGKGSERLKVGVAADLVETRPRFARDPARLVRGADVSPTGRRAVLEMRGEIITVPAKKGDPRNLSRSTAAHDRSPAWSPDGRSVAYFSDASGEYALIVAPADGRGEPKSYPLQGAGYYEKLSWSPDSQHLAFTDNSRTLYVYDLDAKRQRKVASEPVYGPVNTMSHAWSPDSKWLAYTVINRAFFQSVWLYSLADDKSQRVTDGLVDAGEPCFDSGGRWLYFLASTDAGPVRQWFDQSNADMQATASIFLAVLDGATKNPLARPDDQEEPADDGDDTPSDKTNRDGTKATDGHSSPPPETADAKAKAKDGEKSPPKPPTTKVDLGGIEARIVALPIPAGNLSNLEPGPEGTIYYLRRVGYVPGRSGDAFAGTASVVRFKLATREEEPLAEKVDGFKLSANRKSLLYRAKDVTGIVDAGKFKVGDGKLALDGVSIRVEPRAEWRQMAREAWRINRDFFYDPGHHGADWSAVWAKYEGWLDDCPTRGDLNRVIRAMLSELAVGHSNSGGGERVYEPKTVPVGLLGADFEVDDGRYRFRTIYGRRPGWDPSLSAPLVVPGVEVKEGDYLLAVDGEEVRTTDDVYRFFENKVGRKVELTVGPKASGDGSRKVTVEPIASEAALRNRDWVEGNLRTVREKTGGKVAYVYVPNTAELGHAYFKRYFFPQVESQAIIVDERFNGGGSVADYYIDMLRRPVVSYWATRHGEPTRSPGAAILGPKVMLIDETAGSGGDLLPWMFRRFKLGTLVGRRTWGGLVGILGFPTLMDGGAVTAPDIGFYTEDGWRVENEGVPPDVEVEQLPAEVAKGRDPQLERAIEIALKELQANPPKPLPRPEFPVRVRRKAGAK